MNGCKHCNASVSSLFTEVDEEGLSIFLDNKSDGSILALGYIRHWRKGKVETDVLCFHAIRYCPFCGRKLD